MKVLVSHTDLDGLGSVCLSYKYNLFDSIKLANYDDFTSETFLDELFDDNISHLVFADIAPSEDLFLKLIEKGITVNIYDHHKTSEWLNSYEGNICDQTRSGTKIFYEDYMLNYLGLPVMQVDQEFSDIIDVYDRWVKESPLRTLSEMLQKVYISLVDPSTEDSTKYDLIIDNLLLKLSKPTFKLTLSDLDLVEEETLKENQAYDQVLSTISFRADSKNVPFGIWEYCGYTNYCADKLFETTDNIYYVIVVNLEKTTVSLRSKHCQDSFDVTLLSGINGHARAGGGDFEYDFLDNLLHTETEAIPYK